MNNVRTKITDKCPQCNEHLFVDMSRVLTSHPPQYETQCLKCDYAGYKFCDQVETWTPESPAKKKNGCIISILGVFTVFIMFFAFWVWVQFIKLCNWLIELGW